LPLIAFPDSGVIFRKQSEDRGQPGEFFEMPPYINSDMPFGIRLHGDPVWLDGLAFLPLLNGLLDVPVQ